MARRTLIGVVTSAKRDKAITLTVASCDTHPLYGKQYTVTLKYTADAETNEAGEGDKVQIEETRPISKTKSFTLVKVIEKSRGSIKLKDEVSGETKEEAKEDDK